MTALALETSIVDARTAEPGPPLVIAHGLLGQSRNFTTLARGFAEGRRVIAVDMRNHGDSPWSDEMSYAAMAEDLRAAIEGTGGPCDLLGHSMGGKAAMRLALEHPTLLRRLIVADIAPVAYSHSHAELIGAMLALDLSGFANRAQVEAALRESIPDRGTRAFALQNLRIETEGDTKRSSWKSNLAVLLEAMPALVGWEPPLRTDARFEGATLFLHGSASDYVRPEHQSTIRNLFPAARFEAIADAGHWLHAEQPEAFLRACEAFLDAA